MSDMERDSREYERQDWPPDVRNVCVRCANSRTQQNYTRRVEPDDCDIVSHDGFGHLADGTSGHTLCGIDATSRSFWHKIR